MTASELIKKIRDGLHPGRSEADLRDAYKALTVLRENLEALGRLTR